MKSITTNLIAIILIILGYFFTTPNNILFMTGLFAFSGSITNWLAIHMLFEKIPFLYGSGVIPNKFGEFKKGIKKLIIEQFFNKNHIESFFNKNNLSESINDQIDFDKLFESLTEAIIESPLGNMIGMFGGKDALNPLKEPVIKKLKEIINELASGNKNIASGNKKEDIASILTQKVEKIIDERLQELTPQMVKNIIQEMIRKHLGWLVVWGGVFGGLIGFLLSVVEITS